MAEPTTESGRRLLGWFGPEYEPTYREQLGIILAIEQEAASAAVAEVLDVEYVRKRYKRLFKSFEHESLEAERGLLDAVLEAVLGILDDAERIAAERAALIAESREEGT